MTLAANRTFPSTSKERPNTGLGQQMTERATPSRSRLILLFDAAISGGLSVDALELAWPSESADVDSSPLLAALRADLEDGVYHFTGREWDQSDMRKRLILAGALLRSELPDTYLSDLRADILPEIHLVDSDELGAVAAARLRSFPRLR